MISKKQGKAFRKGISLVEMMIFIAVIAILGSITHPHMLGIFARARDASVRCNMFTLQVAAENFASMTHGMYPEQGTTTVGQVLTVMGLPSVNPMYLADCCPGTGNTVATTPDALLPGNKTYGNPIWPTANCLDELGAAVPPGPVMPPHNWNPGPAWSGAGTVYWGPVGTAGTTAMPGYVIYADGYYELISLILGPPE